MYEVFMGDYFRRTDQQITAERLISEAGELAATMRLLYDSDLDDDPDLEQATPFSYSIELNAPNETVYQQKIDFINSTNLKTRIQNYFSDYREFINANFRIVSAKEYSMGAIGNRCIYGPDYQLLNGAAALSDEKLSQLQISNQNLFALLGDRPISIECDAPFYALSQWCDTYLSEVLIVDRGVQFYVGNLVPFGADVSAFSANCDSLFMNMYKN